jgi:AcrR family transcriptional regulator
VATAVGALRAAARHQQTMPTRTRQGDAAERRAVMEALLRVIGTHGYDATTVTTVMRSAGAPRSRFYRHFPDKAAGYAAAHREASGALARELLGAGKGRGWAEAVEEALRRLGAFLARDPALARGVLVEVHAAGGPAAARHELILERLSDAIDSVRREIPGSRHDPPPLTAEFMVRAVAGYATDALRTGRPEDFLAAVPDLARQIIDSYLEWP